MYQHDVPLVLDSTWLQLLRLELVLGRTWVSPFLPRWLVVLGPLLVLSSALLYHDL